MKYGKYDPSGSTTEHDGINCPQCKCHPLATGAQLCGECERKNKQKEGGRL